MDKEIIGILAGVVLLFSYWLYVRDMWWGTTRPSRSSWWVLFEVWVVILLSSLYSAPEASDWVTMTSRWLAIASIAGTLTVAISSIWRGDNTKKRWTKFDWICAICAGIALIFYFLFHNPEVSFIFAILADFSAMFPTIINARDNPEQENLIAWVVTLLSCVISLFAISEWGSSFQSVSNWALPVYLVVIDSITTFFIARRFLFKKKA